MLEITENKNIILIKPRINIVAAMAPKFKEELFSLVRKSPRDFTIDLSGVEMVDSRGLEAIITLHNVLKRKGNKIKVTNTTENIYELFHFLRLDRHFPVEQMN